MYGTAHSVLVARTVSDLSIKREWVAMCDGAQMRAIPGWIVKFGKSRSFLMANEILISMSQLVQPCASKARVAA